jgi:soluble lytic murein transglycosylase-like protein
LTPITWRHIEDGCVAVLKSDVDRTSHGSFPSRVIAVPPDKERPGEWVLREVTDPECVFRWMELAERVHKITWVPVAWILAMIYAESRGDESAEASDGGWGLMQITHPSLKAGLTKEQVFDPYTNVLIGARLAAKHASNVNIGLPGVASCYNAGGKGFGVPHDSKESPWGMRETKGHISRVVAASNALFRRIKAGTC